MSIVRVQHQFRASDLLSVTALELSCSQDVVDVVDNFAVEHHRAVLLVALSISLTTHHQYRSHHRGGKDGFLRFWFLWFF